MQEQLKSGNKSSKEWRTERKGKYFFLEGLNDPKYIRGEIKLSAMKELQNFCVLTVPLLSGKVVENLTVDPPI